MHAACSYNIKVASPVRTLCLFTSLVILYSVIVRIISQVIDFILIRISTK